MIIWLPVLVIAAAPACNQVEGERILLSDLAKGDARFAAAAAQIPAGLAPLPGVKRIFYPPELARLAHENGISTEAPFARLCFERHIRIRGAEEVAAAIQKWAPEGAGIEVLDQSRFAAPEGTLIIPKPAHVQISSDGSMLLRGFVSFGNSQHFPVWARVRVKARTQRVVAAENIRPGDEVSQGQVRIEEKVGVVDMAPFASQTNEVVGHAARRRIDAGTPILLSALEPPKQVLAGAIVQVDVRDGAARLSLEGQAEGSGRTGEMIAVRNPATGKAFRARITGQNAVLVLPEAPKHEGPSTK